MERTWHESGDAGTGLAALFQAPFALPVQGLRGQQESYGSGQTQDAVAAGGFQTRPLILTSLLGQILHNCPGPVCLVAGCQAARTGNLALGRALGKRAQRGHGAWFPRKSPMAPAFLRTWPPTRRYQPSHAPPRKLPEGRRFEFLTPNQTRAGKRFLIISFPDYGTITPLKSHEPAQVLNETS